MGWTVIVNPAAGRGRGRVDVATLLAEVDALAGVDVQVEVSSSSDDAGRRATRAAERGRGLVAAGGDGTVGLLAGIAAEAKVPCTIVPIGSGNDFATMLGFDRKAPLRALDVLRDGDEHGTDVEIDLGRVGDRWFTSVVACGFDSEASRWANTVRRLSGTPLYVAAVLRTLATYRPHPFRVTVDDDTHEQAAWLVAVGNGVSYGGGMRITPDARLDDGRLDICTIGPVSRAKFLREFPKVFKGTHATVDGVTVARSSVVTIESLDAGVPIEIYADGERIGPLPATIECVPRALTVRVPLTSPIA